MLVDMYVGAQLVSDTDESACDALMYVSLPNAPVAFPVGSVLLLLTAIVQHGALCHAWVGVGVCCGDLQGVPGD